MNSSNRKLITQFCLAERLKSDILNMMQAMLRFEDYLTDRKESPDGKTVLSWFLDLLDGEINRAAAISPSENFAEAQSIIADMVQNYKTSDSVPNIQDLITNLRNIISKITSEAAKAANELQF